MFSILFCLLNLVPNVRAMVAPLTVQPNKITSPITSGVISGGSAGETFTLTNVTRTEANNGTETWTLTYGDRLGQPLVAGPGFFHVNVDRNSKRVVIDLAQVSRSGISAGALDRIVKTSKLVANSEMSIDPQDLSTNITLNTKKPVAVRVASESAGTGYGSGRLVLVLSPQVK